MLDTKSVTEKSGVRGENYVFGGLESCGRVAADLGSSTRQIFFSDCRTTPTWLDSEEPTWPTQTTRKRAFRQKRRTSMVWPGVVRKPTPSRRSPPSLRSTGYALWAKRQPRQPVPLTTTTR